MEEFRDQIQRLLIDTPRIEAKTLPNLWPLTWGKIHDKEMIDYSKLMTFKGPGRN
jgi:hypothetical protein